MTFATTVDEWYELSLQHEDTYELSDSLKLVGLSLEYQDHIDNSITKFYVLGALKIKIDCPSFDNKNLEYRLVIAPQHNLSELYTAYRDYKTNFGGIYKFRLVKLSLIHE